MRREIDGKINLYSHCIAYGFKNLKLGRKGLSHLLKM